jgi:hypothetical protein
VRIPRLIRAARKTATLLGMRKPCIDTYKKNEKEQKRN